MRKMFAMLGILCAAMIAQGYEITVVDGVEWTYECDGNDRLVKRCRDNASETSPRFPVPDDLIIPAKIDGREVKEIGNGVFAGCVGLESVRFEGSSPELLDGAGISRKVKITYNPKYAAEWEKVLKELHFEDYAPYEK